MRPEKVFEMQNRVLPEVITETAQNVFEEHGIDVFALEDDDPLVIAANAELHRTIEPSALDRDFAELLEAVPEEESATPLEVYERPEIMARIEDKARAVVEKSLAEASPI